MNRTLFIAGILWGTSLAVAGWIGKTYWAQPNQSSAALQNPAAQAEAALLETNQSSTTAALKMAADQAAASQAVAALTTIPIRERLKKIFDIDDPVERMDSFLAALKSIETNDQFDEAARQMMENFDPRSNGREVSLLMTEWAKRDPQAALAVTTEMDGWQGRYAASTVLQTWVKSNPEAAKAWAIENGSGGNAEDGNYYMVGIIGGLAKKDLDLASRWAQEQPRSRARSEMMDRIVDGFAKQRGISAAQEWVAGLEAGPFRDGITRKVAWKLTESDPVASAAWINNLPASESKIGAMSDLMDRWSDKDPNAAGNWLKNFEPSKETDEPRQSFAWNIREQDPESAIAWAGTISDPKRRERMMVELVKDWSKRDQKSAEDYMNRNRWTPEVMQQVIKRS
jgi:hypothetical protein